MFVYLSIFDRCMCICILQACILPSAIPSVLFSTGWCLKYRILWIVSSIKYIPSFSSIHFRERISLTRSFVTSMARAPTKRAIFDKSTCTLIKRVLRPFIFVQCSRSSVILINSVSSNGNKNSNISKRCKRGKQLKIPFPVAMRKRFY